MRPLLEDSSRRRCAHPRWRLRAMRLRAYTDVMMRFTLYGEFAQ
ncbi:UNVERIFIED_CONTAM: hypothetical protein GTU68_022792 [Idotea baltica]|nr:hypothetical protein [Idotea baltica]